MFSYFIQICCTLYIEFLFFYHDAHLFHLVIRFAYLTIISVVTKVNYYYISCNKG